MAKNIWRSKLRAITKVSAERVIVLFIFLVKAGLRLPSASWRK